MGAARSRSAALYLGGLLVRQAHGTCKLPVHLPEGASPGGLSLGPHNSLVAASIHGTVLFVDLDDYTVREDTALNDRYTDSYGWFDLRGAAMCDPKKSTLIYLGMDNKQAILEYEWHDSHRIYRKFDLPDLPAGAGVRALAWVPTQASSHMGYFYVGCRGQVYIFELPLLEETGPIARAVLRATWHPPDEDQGKDISAIAYSGGYLFVTFDEGNSGHVLIYPVLPSGLPGQLAEQYQVDVASAEGMAVRQQPGDGEAWEVFFASSSERALFAYDFRFITGFELHGRCQEEGITPGARSLSARVAGPTAALVLAASAAGASAWAAAAR